MAHRVLIVLTITLVLTLFIVGAFFYFLFKGHRNWKERIMATPADRQIKNKQSFIDHFSKKGYSAKTSDFIYQKTQAFLRAKDLTLLPQDDLVLLYERQKDEWFYIFNKWFDLLGKNRPDKTTLNDLLTKHKKVNFDYLHDLLDKQI